MAAAASRGSALTAGHFAFARSALTSVTTALARAWSAGDVTGARAGLSVRGPGRFRTGAASGGGGALAPRSTSGSRHGYHESASAKTIRLIRISVRSTSFMRDEPPDGLVPSLTEPSGRLSRSNRAPRLAYVTVSEEPVRLTAWVRGYVQGVGFRWWTMARARELGLVGWARNTTDGQVEVVAEGPPAACRRLLAALRGGNTPGRVADVTEQVTPARGGLTNFVTR